MAVVALLCIAALFATSVLAVTLRGRPDHARSVVYGACLVVSLALGGIAVFAIAAAPSSVTLPFGLPWLGAHFRLDALAAAFLMLVNLGGAGASLYALGYGRHEHEPMRVLPFFPAFLASMNLALLAADAYSFLLTWELMSLTSWPLVMANHRVRDTPKAAYVYLLMASFGTFALLLAFGLLSAAQGGMSFDLMRTGHLSTRSTALALGLVIVGAGSKAGLMPFHVWLPLAHPAAPSHVSALMSGVMTKVAIYAFIRIVFDLMGPPQWWWSLPILSMGGATAALGILHALMETDLKRVLAYSTIENVGIIFVALGLAVAFRANGLQSAAALALTAAVLHALNHMLFKSVLFFGAGTVIVATGEHDMERLGGLIGRMPFSSGAFLAACMAASALPPFNGFVSEWLVFQSILVSPQLPQWGLKILVPSVGVLLALAAALAAACFVRAFGTTYLGRPRTAAAAAAREADRWSVAAMGCFAGLCVVSGVLPGFIIDLFRPVVMTLVGGAMPSQAAIPWLSIEPVSAGRSSYNGLMVLLFVAASAMLMAEIVHRLASQAVRRAAAWDCGYPDAGLNTQYSATSLSQPLRRVLGSVVLQAREEVDMPPPGDIRPASLRRFRRDPAWDFAYAPLAGAVGWAATLLNRFQFLTIRQYLSFVFVALVLLLVVLAVWS